MKRVFALIIFGLAAGAGAATVYQLSAGSWFSTGQPGHGIRSPGNGRSAGDVEAPRAVVALGRLEPAGGVVNVSSVLIGDRLVALVEEGTHVAQHDELGRLDETFRQSEVDLAAVRYAEAGHRLEAERANAQAQLSHARLALQQATSGAAIEVEAQEKQVEVLRLKQQQVGKDLARMEMLNHPPDPIVSAQELEHQQLLSEKAAAEVAAGEAALKQLQQAAEFNKQTAQANVRAAEAALEAVDKGSVLESLKVHLRLAQEKLGRSTVTAPISGTVLKIYTRPGESIAQKPILQMADLNEFACIAEVFETDIKQISIGDRALLRSRAFKGPYDKTHVTGKVKRIANAMPTRELTPLDPLKPVDKHVVQVVIDLADKTNELMELIAEEPQSGVVPAAHDKAQALVNLQVEVTFPAHNPSPPAASLP